MSKLTFSGKLLEKWQIFWYISTFEISKLIEGENQMRFWLLFQWKNQRGGPFTFFRVKINIYQSSPCHAKTAFAPFKWINKMQCIVCLNKNLFLILLHFFLLVRKEKWKVLGVRGSDCLSDGEEIGKLPKSRIMLFTFHPSSACHGKNELKEI